MIRVLLLDDDGLVRETLSRFLRLDGFEVQEASDSGEALDCLEVFAPHIAVVDWMLGDSLDGVEVTAAIRERIPGLPAVIISGYPDVENATQSNEATTQVLAKPFPPSTLSEALRDMLEN